MAKKFLINRFYKAWQKRKCFNKKKDMKRKQRERNKYTKE